MDASGRPFNFSAGPAILPTEVFDQAAEAVRELRLDGHAADGEGIGLSVLEVSHRGGPYQAIHTRALELAYEVLGLSPETYDIMLLPGGASMQFVMVPANLTQPDRAACFVDTGTWSTKAIAEAKTFGEVNVIASSADESYDHIPAFDMEEVSGGSYLHLTTNNTIKGTEFDDIPVGPDGVPVVIDASSHIASRPMSLDRVALGYAGAQKNLGCSGLCLVFARKELLASRAEQASRHPKFLRYGTHLAANSLFNTPNTFGVLVLKLVLEWVQAAGGVEEMGRRNAAKSDLLYKTLDASSMFAALARPGHRSRMTIPFVLQNVSDEQREALTSRFLAEADAAGLQGLKGHRSVGGFRACMYNAFPMAGAEALVSFMREFERRA